MMGQYQRWSYFFRFRILEAALAKGGAENKVINFLSKNIKSRWYSFVKMSMAAKKHDVGFKYCLTMYEESRKDHPAIPEKVIKAINNAGIFRHMAWINTVLKAKSDLIAKLESHLANLGDSGHVC